MLWSLGIWSKLERWKRLISGCLVIWPKIKKFLLKCCPSLFYTTTMSRFPIGLWCATNSWFYTTGDDHFSGWTAKEAPKHFPEPYLNQKTVMVTVGWSRLSHYSFLNPGEIIFEKYAQQISEMHQKLQRLQPAVVNRKGLIPFHDNTQGHVTLN